MSEPLTHEAVRAAAERQRRHMAAKSEADDPYKSWVDPVYFSDGRELPGFYSVAIEQFNNDGRLIRDAYLAEHPADDAEGVTPDRLDRCGLRCRAGYGYRLTPMLSLWHSAGGWGLYFHGGEGDGFAYYNTRTDREESGAVLLATVPNMGTLRTICRALGVGLKGDE